MERSDNATTVLLTSVRIAGRGFGGVEPPYLTLPTSLPLVKIRPGGSSFNPHLSFAEVGMLRDSHFLIMQFLKYLGMHRDDLSVTRSCLILKIRVVLFL